MFYNVGFKRCFLIGDDGLFFKSILIYDATFFFEMFFVMVNVVNCFSYSGWLLLLYCHLFFDLFWVDRGRL